MARSSSHNGSILTQSTLQDDQCMQFAEYFEKYSQRVLDSSDDEGLVITFIERAIERAIAINDFLIILDFIYKNRDEVDTMVKREILKFVGPILAKIETYQEAIPEEIDPNLLINIYDWISDESEFTLTSDAAPTFFRSAICQNLKSFEQAWYMLEHCQKTIAKFDQKLIDQLWEKAISMADATTCSDIITEYSKSNNAIAQLAGQRLLTLRDDPQYEASMARASKYLATLGNIVSADMIEKSATPIQLAQTVSDALSDEEVEACINKARAMTEAPTQEWIEGYNQMMQRSIKDLRIPLIFRFMMLKSAKNFEDWFSIRTTLVIEQQSKFIESVNAKLGESVKETLQAIKAFAYLPQALQEKMLATDIFDKATVNDVIPGINIIQDMIRSKKLSNESKECGTLIAKLMSAFEKIAKEDDWVSALSRSLKDSPLTKAAIAYFEKVS